MRTAKVLYISLALLLLAGCGKKERETITKSTEVDQSVSLAVQSDDLREGNIIEWSFTQTPANVNLTQKDFEPVYTSPQVSFTPPDSGEYMITYVIRNDEGEPVITQPFRVQATAAPAPGDTVQQQMAERDAPEEQPVEEQPEPEPEPEPTTTEREPAPTGETGIAGIPKVPGKYTVQQSAWKSFSKAESVANSLKNLGYEPYIQRAVIPGTERVWYRVRVGEFSSFAAANELHEKLENDPEVPNAGIWVDFMRKDM